MRKALYAQRPAHRLLSALRNGSICDCATVIDAAPIARGRRVAIDGSSGLPSNKADGQVTQTARDEAAGAVRVAGRRGARADERRAERAAERRADVAADRAADRAADGHAVISTHDVAAADADAGASTYACTDNGPDDRPFLDAVVDADRGAQRQPDDYKGADARRRRRGRVVRLPGQRNCARRRTNPWLFYGAPAALVLCLGACALSCGVWFARRRRRDSKIADAGPRVRERHNRRRRRSRTGPWRSGGSSFCGIIACPPSSFLDPSARSA